MAVIAAVVVGMIFPQQDSVPLSQACAIGIPGQPEYVQGAALFGREAAVFGTHACLPVPDMLSCAAADRL